jgi:hypothetical protein
MDRIAQPETAAARIRAGDITSRARAFLRDHAFPIGVFVFLRAWTMLWASVTAAFVPLAPQAASYYYGAQRLHDALIAPWQRWDTIWYAKIALEGYAADESSHFPLLYPFLIRLLAPVFGSNAVAAGLVISSIAALASFVLLYRLAREMFDEGAARRAVLFLGVFPTAFFLFAAYTEPLFLALVLGAFLCARRGLWGWTGILGALAAMTRQQGMLFILPLAVEFWAQYRRGDVPWSRVWTLVPVLVGGTAQVLWLTFQFGTPSVWFQSERIMHRIVPPWEALGAGWRAVFHAPSVFDAALSFLDPFCVVLLCAAIVWSARRLPIAMTLYLAIVLLPSLFVVTTYSDAYPLTSVSRFVVLAFPFFMLWGSLRKRVWQLPVLGFSFLLQTFGLVLFAAWVFVR